MDSLVGNECPALGGNQRQGSVVGEACGVWGLSLRKITENQWREFEALFLKELNSMYVCLCVATCICV